MLVINCQTKEFLGKNSMYLLCIHYIDLKWVDFWFVGGRNLVSAMRRVCLDILVVIIFVLIKNAIDMIKARYKSWSA